MPSSFFSSSKLDYWYTTKKMSTYTIAYKYNCDPKTVFYWLMKYKISTRPKKVIPIDRKSLKEIYKSGHSLKNIGRQYGITASAVYRKMIQNKLLRRTPWEKNIIHKRNNFSNDLFEKAYLIGFRIGDLHVTKNSSSITVKSNTTHLVQVTLLKTLFSPYGPVWISSPITNKRVYHCTIGLNHTFNFLVKKHKTIPGWITRSNSLCWSFMAGFTDAEGTIRIYTKRARLRIGSYDKSILKQFHHWLTKLGIINSFRLESPADGVKQNGDFYRVDIMNRYALFSCLPKLIPLLKHGRRKLDAQEALTNVTKRIKTTLFSDTISL